MGNFSLVPLIVIALVIFFIRKVSKSIKNNKSDNRNDTSIINNQNKIPILDTCPHCKNPNTKKIRLCEWCGSQIT